MDWHNNANCTGHNHRPTIAYRYIQSILYLLYNLDIISPSTSHQKTPHSRRSKDRNECEKLKYRERRKEAARKKKLARAPPTAEELAAATQGAGVWRSSEKRGGGDGSRVTMGNLEDVGDCKITIIVSDDKLYAHGGKKTEVGNWTVAFWTSNDDLRSHISKCLQALTI